MSIGNDLPFKRSCSTDVHFFDRGDRERAYEEVNRPPRMDTPITAEAVAVQAIAAGNGFCLQKGAIYPL